MLRFIVLLLTALISQFSFAADITYEGGYQWRFRTYTYYYNEQVVSPWGTAPDASACNALRSAYMAAQPTWVYEGSASVSGIGSSARCTFSVRPCSTCSLVSPNAAPDTAAYTCPSNSSPVSGGCNCNSGFVPQNGQCVPPPNPCVGMTGQSMVQFGTFVWPRGVTSACSGGCAQTVTGDSPFDFYWKDETTGQFLGHYTSNQFVFTGEQCTGGTAPAALPQNEATEETIAPKCKAGEYYGQVNGQDVCVPSSSTSSTTETTEQTKDSSGNTTGTATTSKDVECEGDSCTVTTTTTNADGTSKVTTGTVSKGEHCASNPGSRECEVSQFAGTCQTGFTCKGDAIQCAQARVQWDSYCKLHADEAAMSLYESAAAKYNTDITGDLPGNQSNVFGSDWFDSSDALGGGSCVADVHVSQWIVEFDIPLSQLCQQLLWLNYALTAAGSLIWALIVFRR